MEVAIVTPMENGLCCKKKNRYFTLRWGYFATLCVFISDFAHSHIFVYQRLWLCVGLVWQQSQLDCNSHFLYTWPMFQWWSVSIMPMFIFAVQNFYLDRWPPLVLSSLGHVTTCLVTSPRIKMIGPCQMRACPESRDQPDTSVSCSSPTQSFSSWPQVSELLQFVF